MTRNERKLANALRRVIDALDDYASDKMFDDDEPETRSSARRVDREIAKGRKVLREAEGLVAMQPAPMAPTDGGGQK
jgi:hypothetical protein